MKKINIHVRTWTFVCRACFYLESWLKCWKPAESLLRTWEMIAKCQTSGLSFHQVCETIMIICFNPLREAIVYFAMKMMKCSYIYESSLDLIEKLFLRSHWRWHEWLHNKPVPIGSKVIIFTWSPADLWVKVCSHDRDASKQRKRMFPWLQQMFVGEEDCMTRLKNVCAGGYQRDCSEEKIY